MPTNYLGIDWGERRIGLACGDSELALALPIPAAVEATAEARLTHIATEIERRHIHELVVGYPYNMDGSVGFKAREVDQFIDLLTAKFGLPVHRMDERLSSRQASQSIASKKNSRKKNSPKAVIRERKSGELDSRSAAIILQDYLDSRTATTL